MADTGRPSKYDEKMNQQAFKLCLLGATDKELADFLGIVESTLNEWKHTYPAFSESIKEGKEQADGNVADRLYKRAMGYSHDAVKIAVDANTGKHVAVPYTEHYPPDTAACIFWLKNRQKNRWRDKHETELTGKDGTPLFKAYGGIDVDKV